MLPQNTEFILRGHLTLQIGHFIQVEQANGLCGQTDAGVYVTLPIPRTLAYKPLSILLRTARRWCTVVVNFSLAPNS